MKTHIVQKLLLFLLAAAFACSADAQQRNFWSAVNESSVNRNLFAGRTQPQAYKIFRLNESALSSELKKAPLQQRVSVTSSSFILSIPNPNGTLERYRIVQSSSMDPSLSARYPNIRSYKGIGIDKPSSIIYFDISVRGFHAMVLSGQGETFYIDAVDRQEQLHVVFSRKSVETRNYFKCLLNESGIGNIFSNENGLRNADDGKLRTYRLALACTGEYAQHFVQASDSTDSLRKQRVLAAMNTTISRVNGIFELEFSIHLNLVANNDKIIYLNPATDPWGTELNTRTQTVIDSVIGNANYDIGHLFQKGSNNGNAGFIGCVCETGKKGSAFTSHTNPQGDPFVVDYVCHEMGHQFGGRHTFTYANENNIAQVEPGSGSTIMGYAGITGANTDVQANSDPYFHAISIQQITNYVKSAAGGGCATVTETNNAAPTANAGNSYTIPKSTPFVLKGGGTDQNGGSLSYNWEQMNQGSPATTIPSETATAGPVFRSFPATTDTFRFFPALESILDGTNKNKWEVLPSVARTLDFRLTVRDNNAGGGANGSADMQVTIAANAGPFKVTTLNTTETWKGGACKPVKWDVAGTDAGTVNCANVKISLSTDGGQTFSRVLIESTPNDGKEAITVPEVNSTSCRIKVEAIDNIFFDINDVDFTISGTTTIEVTVDAKAITCNNPKGKATITVKGLEPEGELEYSLDSVYQSSNEFSDLEAGSYTASVRFKDSTCTYTKGFTIADSSITVSISGAGKFELCEDESITLTASASGGSGNYSFSWPGGSLEVSSSGHYSVTVTDTETGCTKTEGGDVVIVPIVCSRDPNDIIGPEGFGPRKMIAKSKTYSYMVRFENDPDFATAPAQVVKINHPLDTNANLLSLRLGDFGFGGFIFTIPPPARTFYSTRLNLLDSLGVVVDVTAGIDINKKEAFWIFESKDPNTGLPPTDATLGFLPVNDSTSKGEGFVTYVIKAATHTNTGDSIRAKASIIFDINAAIETPAIFNIIDALPPVSNIKPMPATSPQPQLVVKWSAHDDVGGSGVRDYVLYVSANGGAFSLHQSGITDSSVTFTGVSGNRYGFFVQATDNVGNQEPLKNIAEVTVEIGNCLAEEICNNGVDDNCNGLVDEGCIIVVRNYYRDADGDGYGRNDDVIIAATQPVGYVLLSGDCHDWDANIHPGATEICDFRDNDCDGQVDEGCTVYYRDADGDGFGLWHQQIRAMSLPPGYSTIGGDCNDANAAIRPGAAETCNGVDDNCNGIVDEGCVVIVRNYYRDADGDGYGRNDDVIVSATQPVGYVLLNGDCHDWDATIHPGAPEICDWKDNDCDGQVDEGCFVYYRDADGDFYGRYDMPLYTNTAPAGYSRFGGDCNDADPLIHPDIPELCNGKDDNCNGIIDDWCFAVRGTDLDKGKRIVPETGPVILTVTVHPNPTGNLFNVRFLGDHNNGRITVRISDFLGRPVETINNVVVGQTIKLGARYARGLYVLEAMQGRQRRMVKIEKL